MTHVLAIDPGEATGWAFLYPDGHIEAGELVDPLLFCDWSDSMLNVMDRYTVVIEAYDITAETAKKSRQYAPLKIIGTVEWLCHTYGHDFVISPRAAKGFATNDKLKAVGWYTPTPGGHANDAVRHLLNYQVPRDPALLARLSKGLGL